MSHLGVSHKQMWHLAMLRWGQASLISKYLIKLNTFITKVPFANPNYNLLCESPAELQTCLTDHQAGTLFVVLVGAQKLERTCRSSSCWTVRVHSGQPVTEFWPKTGLTCPSSHTVRTTKQFLVFSKTGKHLCGLSLTMSVSILQLHIFWNNCDRKLGCATVSALHLEDTVHPESLCFSK